MKMLTLILFVGSVAASLCPTPVRAQSANESPKFEVKIQTEGEGAPRYTVTNLTGSPVTACVISITSSSDSKDRSHIDWDALLQNVPPIEPNASISQYLGHRVGGPLPDRVVVIAAVRANGETFGDPKWLNMIIQNRELALAGYDQAIAILREGIDHNWARDQYLQALNNNPDSDPLHGIVATLTANPDLDPQPERLNRVMQKMLDIFTARADQLRKATPTVTAASPG